MSNFATASSSTSFGVELVLEQRDEVALVQRLVSSAAPPPVLRSATVVAIESRRPVTSCRASRTRSRLRGSSSFSRWNSRRARELEREHVPVERRGSRLTEERSDPDRLRLCGRNDAPLPRVLKLRELKRRGLGAAVAAVLVDRGAAPRVRRPAGAPATPDGRARLGTRGGAPAPQRWRASSSSTRCASDSRWRSACGRVTFTSASSSGSRGSPPWRMSSTATARRSIRRSTLGSGSWFACSRSRSRVSSVTGSESGTVPMFWTSRRWRRWSSRSVTSRPRS